MFRDIPDRLGFLRCHFLELVFAFVRVVGQVADIGDVDDMGELVTLPAERPPQQIGKNIGPHITDMGIVIDRRSAGIDARFTRMHGHELFHLASQAVEQFQRMCGSVIHLPSPNGFPRKRSTDQLFAAIILPAGAVPRLHPRRSRTYHCRRARNRDHSPKDHHCPRR